MNFEKQQSDKELYTIITTRIKDEDIHINSSNVDDLEELVNAIVNDDVRTGDSRMNGVIFSGIPGTGKTYTIQHVRTKASDRLGYDIPLYSVGSLKSREDVVAIFKEARVAAKEKGRALLFFDEIDAYGKRADHMDPDKAAILNELLIQINGVESNEGLTVASATNRPNAIDPAFRRGKRCDLEIKFDPLDKEGREHIANIEAYNRGHQFVYNNGTIKNIVEESYGSVGADIANLIIRASNRADMQLSRQMNEIVKEVLFNDHAEKKNLVAMCKELPVTNISISYNDFIDTLYEKKEKWVEETTFEKNKSYETKLTEFVTKKARDILNPNAKEEEKNDSLENTAQNETKATKWITINDEDITHVMERFVPSALKDMPFEETKFTFSSFAGISGETSYLKKIVESTIAKGKDGTTIYMYGKTGHGVTSLAKSVAGEFGYNLIVLYGADQESQWVGVVKDRLLEINDRAKASQPTVVVLDMLKYLAHNGGGFDQSYKQAATSALKQILKPTKGVIYIATGETPEEVEPSIYSLFHRHIEVPKPEGDGVYEKIWDMHIDDVLRGNELDLRELAKHSNGLTGGDIRKICRFFTELDVSYEMNKLQQAIKVYSSNSNGKSDVQLAKVLLQ